MLCCCLEEDEDDEILSSSATGRLWKASFGRRGAQHFLDICLLKKSYMKALDDLGEEEQDTEVVSSILNDIVDQAVLNHDDDDDAGLVSRIAKRSIASTMSVDGDDHQMKRLRSNATGTLVSV